jgi:hypothetical protein
MMKHWLFILVVALAVCGCGKPAAKSSAEVTLDDLNRAYTAMSMRGHQPTNIDELMNFPTLQGKSLPTTPAGKKLVLDSKAACAVFVDQ